MTEFVQGTLPLACPNCGNEIHLSVAVPIEPEPTEAQLEMRIDDAPGGRAVPSFEVEEPQPPTCSLCRRQRFSPNETGEPVLQDGVDYSPVQVMTGQPVGWYSGDDGEVCPPCMSKTLGQ